MKLLEDHTYYKNKDDEQQLYAVLEASIKGTVVGYESYKVDKRKIKEITKYDPDTGEVKFEEKEINDWSGMSLGDDTAPSSFEKFPIICSLCKQEKTVPFKPEKGRPAYCKECIAKIKSGEVKVEKSSENQIRYDDSKFFKPLADLGIEFELKDGDKNGEIVKNDIDRHPEREIAHRFSPPVKAQPAQSVAPNPYKVQRVETVKPTAPVFNKSNPLKVTVVKKPSVEKVALKEVLQKVTTALPIKVGIEPISLDALKQKNHEILNNKPARLGGDRAASADDMNKLKDLIATKIPTSPLPTKVGTPTQVGAAPIPTPEKTGTQPPLTTGNVKEVPEDVLKKLLE